MVTISSILAGRRRELDPDVEQPVPVRFDVDGRLDARVHSADVVIPLEMEDERTTITVKTGGVIR